jgi:hypothetical protein
MRKLEFYQPFSESGKRSLGHYFGSVGESSKDDSRTEFEKHTVEYLVVSADKALEAAVQDPNCMESSLSTTEGNPATSSRRRFASFRIAKEKILKAPVSIPGIITGSALTVAPSHSSHMQAVQAAVATSNSAARKEMWPLQLLAANRPKETPAVATGVNVSGARSLSSDTRSHGSSSTRAPSIHQSILNAQESTSDQAVGSQGQGGAQLYTRNSASTVQSFLPPSNPTTDPTSSSTSASDLNQPTSTHRSI